MLTQSAYCLIVTGTSAKHVPTFRITNTKYVPVVTLSTQDNAKLLEPLKSGFKRPLDWNKYRSKMTKQAQNQYLDFLI